MIKMFCLLFLNNLWQLPRDNPWPTHSTNKNYRIRFHKQHDYLFGFQAKRRINKSLLLWNWAKNASNVEDDEYETLVLAYNKKLDSLISTSCITRSLEEEESSPPHIEDVVTNSKKEMENTLPPFQGYANSKDMTLTPTPWWVLTNWTTHQWNLVQLNISKVESINTSEIGNY